MIRIKKTPLECSLRKNRHTLRPKRNKINIFNPNLVKLLSRDQHGKCYICERRLSGLETNIEHLRPVSLKEGLNHDWNNLLVSCSMCNKIKSDDYQSIVNPTTHNICRLIKHVTSFENNLFYFIPLGNKLDGPLKIAASLLDKIFNRTVLRPSYNSENIHNKAMFAMKKFRLLCESYIATKDESIFYDIERQLRPDAEFLAFKYWFMKEDEALSFDFRKQLNKIF